LAYRVQAAQVATLLAWGLQKQAQTNPYEEKVMRLKTKKMVLMRSAAFAIAGCLLAIGSTARADETTVVSRSAPDTKTGLYNAFEIGIGAGYVQGVGDVGDGVHSLTDSGGPGVFGELDLGWRINPNWLVGVYGTTGWLSTGDASGNAHNNWTTSAGVQGTYHFLPGENFDPWITLGTGWRAYFVNRPEGRDARHGWEFARLQVGVDIPTLQPGITISPYIGASSTLFFTQELAQDTSFSDIQNRKVNVFLNAGVMGRFDVLGSNR
jgi:hypothetical protein